MALKETWQSYNETTKQYETSHPETEVSQVVGLAAAIEAGTKSAIDKNGWTLLPKVTVTTLSGSTVTATNGTSALNSTEAGSTGEFSFEIPSLGKWTFTATKTGSKAFTRSVTVDVEEIKEYKVEIAHGVRYGYRVKKDEGNPYGRVEYLFDAVGLTPAKMDFTKGVFDYGSWKDKWFVVKNKPCMVRSNGRSTTISIRTTMRLKKTALPLTSQTSTTTGMPWHRFLSCGYLATKEMDTNMRLFLTSSTTTLTKHTRTQEKTEPSPITSCIPCSAAAAERQKCVPSPGSRLHTI